MVRKRKLRRAMKARIEQGAADVLALQGELAAAWGRFNRSADGPAAEAAILELGALDRRYGAALSALKALELEAQGGFSDDRCNRNSAHRGLRAAGDPAEAAEKADQVGV